MEEDPIKPLRLRGGSGYNRLDWHLPEDQAEDPPPNPVSPPVLTGEFSHANNSSHIDYTSDFNYENLNFEDNMDPDYLRHSQIPWSQDMNPEYLRPSQIDFSQQVNSQEFQNLNFSDRKSVV